MLTDVEVRHFVKMSVLFFFYEFQMSLDVVVKTSYLANVLRCWSVFLYALLEFGVSVVTVRFALVASVASVCF